LQPHRLIQQRVIVPEVEPPATFEHVRAAARNRQRIRGTGLRDDLYFHASSIRRRGREGDSESATRKVARNNLIGTAV
jgi:hypothetical protein